MCRKQLKNTIPNVSKFNFFAHRVSHSVLSQPIGNIRELLSNILSITHGSISRIVVFIPFTCTLMKEFGTSGAMSLKCLFPGQRLYSNYFSGPFVFQAITFLKSTFLSEVVKKAKQHKLLEMQCMSFLSCPSQKCETLNSSLVTNKMHLYFQVSFDPFAFYRKTKIMYSKGDRVHTRVQDLKCDGLTALSCFDLLRYSFDGNKTRPASLKISCS